MARQGPVTGSISTRVSRLTLRLHCSLLFEQVERQIDQMVRFIKQEAEEKANEINVSAEEVCDAADLGCLADSWRLGKGSIKCCV